MVCLFFHGIPTIAILIPLCVAFVQEETRNDLGGSSLLPLGPLTDICGRVSQLTLRGLNHGLRSEFQMTQPALKLRWKSSSDNAGVANLLAQMNSVRDLECTDSNSGEGGLEDISAIAYASHSLRSLRLNDFVNLRNMSPVGLCFLLTSFKMGYQFRS